MQQVSINVRAEWDDEAGVWVITSDEIAGLAIEAEKFEDIRSKVIDAVCDLVEDNDMDLFRGDASRIPLHIMAEQSAWVPNPCH